jgi:hypothetical protein
MGIPQKENPFLEALRVATEREASHYERQEAATRAFFANHPENQHELFETESKVVLFLPWQEGKRRFVHEVVSERSEMLIDVEQRFGRGWFERCTDDSWIGLPQQRGEKKDWRWSLPPEETYADLDKPIQKELPLIFEVA